jgi:hypothetical protein
MAKSVKDVIKERQERHPASVSTAGQEWAITEHHIDEILLIAKQDMTAAFGDSAEQYRREAIKAILAAENWAGVCYERRTSSRGSPGMAKSVKDVIKERLEYHPGDAPWSCVECYHGRPCVDRKILLLALQALGEGGVQEVGG